MLGVAHRRFGALNSTITLLVQCMLTWYLNHGSMLVHLVAQVVMGGAATSTSNSRITIGRLLAVHLGDLVRVRHRCRAKWLLASVAMTVDNYWVLCEVETITKACSRCRCALHQLSGLVQRSGLANNLIVCT